MSSPDPLEGPSIKKGTLPSSSAGGASLLIGLQVASRALTFIVNQVLLRYLSPERLGISVQLEVYSISVLFFAREALRVAIQRESDIPDEAGTHDGDKEVVKKGHVDANTAAGRTQGIVNLAWISFYLGPLFAVFLGILYTSSLRSGSPEVIATPYFNVSLKFYGVAALWELLSEPAFVVVQQKNRFRVRAAAEGTATVLRCLGTCSMVIWAARRGEDFGVLPFAIGQVIYAVTLLLVYYWNVWTIASEGGFFLILAPIISPIEGSYLFGYFSRHLLTLGRSLFAQSIVKHILTQGDTLLIASMASPHAQGIYALANNYGGLIARLLLQPIEESSRNYFGKLLSTPSSSLVLKARSDLHSVLRAYILFSVCILAVGPTMAPLLLKIVASERWSASGAGHVLGTYCYYIPLLAINGITEAFVSSVATKEEVNRQSVWMLAFSAGFGSAAYIFLRVLDLGAEGLVWANSLNMLFRIIWSTTFISSYMKRKGTNLGIGTMIPKPTSIAAGVGTYAILTQLEKTFTGGLSDLIVSGAVSGIFTIILAASERVYLLENYQAVRGRKV